MYVHTHTNILLLHHAPRQLHFHLDNGHKQEGSTLSKQVDKMNDGTADVRICMNTSVQVRTRAHAHARTHTHLSPCSWYDCCHPTARPASSDRAVSQPYGALSLFPLQSQSACHCRHLSSATGACRSVECAAVLRHNSPGRNGAQPGLGGRREGPGCCESRLERCRERED